MNYPSTALMMKKKVQEILMKMKKKRNENTNESKKI
jgi:hypothetical protein